MTSTVVVFVVVVVVAVVIVVVCLEVERSVGETSFSVVIIDADVSPVVVAWVVFMAIGMS